MSLGKAKWRYLGSANFASATCAAVLDALYTLLISTNTTYPDNGSNNASGTRTAGSGSAATWNRYQNAGVTECLYATMNQGTCAVLISGCASLPTPSPTMASPDTAVTNMLMITVVKNPGSTIGAFSSWNAASPMTTGTTFGYWRVWPTSAGTGKVRAWESVGGIRLTISTATDTTYHAEAGANFDPESSDTTNDAESDGYLYGVITSGSGAVAYTASHSSAGGYGDHTTGNGSYHAGIFQPGTGSLLTMRPAIIALASMSTTGTKSRSGQYRRIPLFFRAFAGAPSDQLLCRWREVTMFSDALNGQKQTNGSNVVCYVAGTHESVTNDCWALEAGP